MAVKEGKIKTKRKKVRRERKGELKVHGFMYSNIVLKFLQITSYQILRFSIKLFLCDFERIRLEGQPCNNRLFLESEKQVKTRKKDRTKYVLERRKM